MIRPQDTEQKGDGAPFRAKDTPQLEPESLPVQPGSGFALMIGQTMADAQDAVPLSLPLKNA